MRDNRDILDKLKWLSTDMEDMEVPGDWLLPVNEAHSIIVRMREKLEKLRVENIQMQAALGYAICAEDERHIIPSNPYKCGVCDANRGVHDRIEQLEAEAKTRTLDYLGQVGQLSEELERVKREAERAQDAYGVRFLNYLEETARLSDEIERLRVALRDALSYSTIGDMPVTIYEKARAALEGK